MEGVEFGCYSNMLLMPGRPYSAQVEMSRRDGIRWNACSGFIARDGGGRERFEIHLLPTMTIVTIKDPIGQKCYTIEPEAGAFTEEDYPPEMQGWSATVLPHDVKETSIKEGVECWRGDFTLRVGDGPTKSITTWNSLQAGLVEEESVSSSGVKMSWRLHHIVLEVPDPDLFRVPPGLQLTKESKPL